MSFRLKSSYLVFPALLLAGGLALYGVGRSPEATASTAAPVARDADPLPVQGGMTLPPNHPPIGAGAATSSLRSAQAQADDPPAIVWAAPEAWKSAPSPNGMRLATYLAPGGVDVSVARAGGGMEANIQRWTAQFDDVGRESRVETTVRGIHVVTVDMAGTYVGGGAGMGGPAEPRPDWAMVGAIVQGPGPSYFFKMTGPAASVRAARAAFDRMVGGISPT